MKKLLGLISFLLVLAGSVSAKVVLPAIFSDNMVLQQNAQVNLWGKATPGERVSVKASWTNKTVTTKAAADGKWTVKLKTPAAAKGQSVTVSGENTITINNVLVGEVWLCTGQSNMEYPVSRHPDKKWMTGMITEAEEMKDADYPELRLFRVEHQLAPDGEMDDCQGRWLVCTPKNLYDFSAVGFVFGRRLHKELNVPVGMIQSTWGGTHAESWTKMSVMKNNPLYADVLEDFALKNVKQEKGYCKVPATLWNGMIHPILGYTVKGNIWYQGESNAHNMEAHEKLFHLLTKNWRENWAEELPFYYVQLSSIDRPSWPWFRDSQRRMLQSIPNSGMAVSSDHGDSLDVHPRHKREIGERLAHWALNKTYGHEILPSGPLYRSVIFKDSTAYVTFDYGKGMHSSDGDKLRTFEIAEHDGLFVPAEAQIIDGKTVKVWSGQIRNPKFVRYGWQPFTRANLVNEAGLPASTFRSEAAPVSWFRLPDLPGTEKSPSLGVSAPFTGVSGGQLFVAGGCNFPGKPAAEGGTKEYYCNIYALDITARSHAGWKRIGKLPIPLAYGASVTTPEGLVWIGGNNNKEVSRQVFFVNWDGEKQQLHITELPPLPMPLDNLSATYADGCLYVAGGKGKPQTVPIGQDGSQTAPTNPLFSLQLTPSLQKEWVRLPDFPGPARVQPVLTAQQSEDGIRLYLAGGFQPASAHQEAIVCTEMLSYHPKTKQWRNEGFLPSLAGGSHRTVTGGCAIASGDSSILLVGGVNYDRFRDALNHPEPDYLLHPADWYKFNTSLLQYNTFTKHWTHLGNYEELARAGAGIANNANTVIIIGGELKPGIRTPEVNAFKLTCHP